MPKFKLTGPDGGTYMVDAPDEQSAVSAFKSMNARNAVAGERGSPLDPLVQGASFSFGDELAGAFGAGMQALGIPGALGEMSPGDAYTAYRDRARTNLEGYREDHPVAATALEFAGALPTAALPVGHIARGATLGAKMGRGAMVGGGYGAVQGIGGADPEAQDWGSSAFGRGMGAADGAVIGGGLGVAFPLAGRAVGRTISGITRRRAPTKAASLAAEAMEADTLTPDAARWELARLGDQGMIADLGPNLQTLAGGVASMPGRGQQFVRGAITDRAKGANPRIRGEIDTTLGPAVIPSQVRSAIQQGQKLLGPAYDHALQGAKAVDTQDIANALDSEIVNIRGRAADRLAQVRDMLNITGQEVLDPNPGTLLQTRHAIDGLLAGEKDTNVIRVLSAARRQIDDELRAKVPGIKEVDAQYAELARQLEGFERGRTVLGSGRDAPVPQELADEFASATAPQGLLIGPSGVPIRLREGARAEIERIVGTHSNDVVALNQLIKGEGSWNRDRLATLFGASRADRIIKVLDRERQFAGTADVVTRNSETARRQAVQQQLSPEPAGGDGMVRSTLNIRLGDAAARPVDWLRRVNAEASAEDVRNELAWLLASREAAQGPLDPQVERLTRALMQRNRGRSAENFATEALGVAGRGAVPQLSVMPSN